MEPNELYYLSRGALLEVEYLVRLMKTGDWNLVELYHFSRGALLGVEYLVRYEQLAQA